MNLSCLIVDDDPDTLENLRTQIRSSTSDVVIAEASSAREAQELLATSFFHIAVVDLNLKGPATNNTDGEKVLRALAMLRPSCKRYLYTQYLERSDVLQRLLAPGKPLIHGVLNKKDWLTSASSLITQEAVRLRGLGIAVDGLDKLTEALKSKVPENYRTRLSPEEIIWVMTGLFSDLEPSGEPDDSDIASVRLEFLEGGRSRSVVVKAEPIDRGGRIGIACVIKLGLSSEITEEMRRYCRYVKFSLSLNRRVELLHTSIGDTISAMCYSFVGQSVDNITTLQTLFEAEDPRALKYFSALFDPTRKEWYARTSEGQDLGGFFANAFNLKPMEIASEIRRFLEHLPAHLGKIEGDHFLFNGGSVSLPTVLGSGKLRKKYLRCVAHGDLNGRNVIIPRNANPGHEDQLVLIDYRHTGVAPAGIDFASMEASVREASTPDSLAEVLQAARFEKTCWKSVWFGRVIDTCPYWVSASVEIGRKLRVNFPEITEEDYAAVCLLLALRLFRIHQLPEAKRFRLAIWIGHLSEILHEDRSN